MKPRFVRTANPSLNNNVIPFPNLPDNAETKEEEDASYPGVGQIEKDVAFGKVDPSSVMGIHPDAMYKPEGEF